MSFRVFVAMKRTLLCLTRTENAILWFVRGMIIQFHILKTDSDVLLNAFNFGMHNTDFQDDNKIFLSHRKHLYCRMLLLYYM